MSIKPHYETYRYTSEIARLKAQSIVECRLPGSEITSVLAVQANAVPSECACADGEVRYNGKLVLSVLYEDADRKVCRAERGAEFFHKAEHSEITPACYARAILKTENITVRREGSGLYISVVVGAELPVYGQRKMEYLVGGENLVVQKDVAKVVKLLSVAGESEREDEFETDYVGDILLHSENAVVVRAVADAGQIEIEGEMNLNICVLKSDESLCAYERLVPFKMQVPCEDAFGDLPVSVNVRVKSAYLTAGTDEEKGKSKIVLSTVLSAECTLYQKDEIPVVSDAYSPTCETPLKKGNVGGRCLTNVQKCVERVGGTAILSEEIEDGYALQAAVLPRVEISCRKNERGETEAEGIAQAEVLFRSADGTHKKATLSLPFAFPVNAGEDEKVEGDGLLYGLNVRRKKSGEVEAEGSLKAVFRHYKEGQSAYVCEVEEGEAVEENRSGISIFLPRAGEDLWQVAKRLRCTPEELTRSNPDLKFPIENGERILVYRRLAENLEK